MRLCLCLLIVSVFAAIYFSGFDAAPVPDPDPAPGIFASRGSHSRGSSSSRSSSSRGSYGSRSRSRGSHGRTSGSRSRSRTSSRSGGSGWMSRTRNKLRRGRDKIKSKLGSLGNRAKSKYRRTKEKVKTKISNWRHKKKPSSSGDKPSRTRRIWNKIRGKDKNTNRGGSSGHRSTAGRIWDKIRGRNKNRPSTGGGSSYPRKGTGGVGIIGTPRRKAGWKKKAKGLIKKLAGSAAVRKIGKKIFAKITRRKPKYYSSGYGRHYWYGDRYYGGDPYRYYVGQNRMDEYNIMKCMYQMPQGGMPNEEDYDVNFEYEDGQAVQTIVFNCDKRYEVCCGLDCCPRPRRRWGWGRGDAAMLMPSRLIVTTLVMITGTVMALLEGANK